MKEFYKLEKGDLINSLEKKQKMLVRKTEGQPLIIGGSLWTTKICLKVLSNITDEQYIDFMER